MEQKFISDPDLYEKLEKPFSSREEMLQNYSKFYDEVCKLREKYQISEFVIAFTCFLEENKHIIAMPQFGYRGGKLTEALISQLFVNTLAGETLNKLGVALQTTERTIDDCLLALEDKYISK